jgi:hypothetical protein
MSFVPLKLRCGDDGCGRAARVASERSIIRGLTPPNDGGVPETAGEGFAPLFLLSQAGSAFESLSIVSAAPRRCSTVRWEYRAVIATSECPR